LRFTALLQPDFTGQSAIYRLFAEVNFAGLQRTLCLKNLIEIGKLITRSSNLFADLPYPSGWLGPLRRPKSTGSGRFITAPVWVAATTVRRPETLLPTAISPPGDLATQPIGLRLGTSSLTAFAARWLTPTVCRRRRQQR